MVAVVVLDCVPVGEVYRDCPPPRSCAKTGIVIVYSDSGEGMNGKTDLVLKLRIGKYMSETKMLAIGW